MRYIALLQVHASFSFLQRRCSRGLHWKIHSSFLQVSVSRMIYAETNRPLGRPDRRIKVLDIRERVIVVVVIGRLDQDDQCNCPPSQVAPCFYVHKKPCKLWGVGIGRVGCIPKNWLGQLKFIEGA